MILEPSKEPTILTGICQKCGIKSTVEFKPIEVGAILPDGTLYGKCPICKFDSRTNKMEILH